ncbi:cytochrome-c peroxidase [Sphaerotilus sp.]|uniref:cytochrome-c peroxidase n=1 Tax=Sphaerotilus sp. TaxID=2093942 RepID=UPI002ACD3376|nr:cytochrome c peroxidase [Sphaerotilus sp.]MDZ7858699.1 cytochrome c peroxidase [Sphaerotilus sp.]
MLLRRKPSTGPVNSTPLLRMVSLVSLVSFAAIASDQTLPAATDADKAWLLPPLPIVAGNPITPAKAELGKILFFDPRLSANGTISCASCHNPSLGWSDGLKTGIGINGTVLNRATPTIVNMAYNTQFMWDGRKRSLEEQALGPMKTPEEMKTDLKEMVRMMESVPGYREMFDKAFPGEPISEDIVAKALATFQRTVVSTNSRFDRWLEGDRQALTVQEWRGYQVFKDPARGNCAVCHSGANFTDNGFHNIGITQAEGSPDTGRFKVRALAVLKGAFKTPTLRDVALTAPYFHDGSAPTLMDVVEHYDRGGDDKRNLSKDIRPLHLSPLEKEDLVAFMTALNGQGPHVTLPRLPQALPLPHKAAPTTKTLAHVRTGD